MDLKSLPNKTLAIIMGGGAGTRLYPLTQKRAKPAVPLDGKYRLVDIPISNCLNSGFRQVYVLTQYNSESLHRHITVSYKFENFTKSFVEILAAQQTPEDSRWYQGTADAVRQNLRYFLERPYEYYLILSGDQLYRMDYGDLLQAHLQTGADVTLGTTPVDRAAASGFGIMHSDANRRIFRFEEKPKDPKLLVELHIPRDLLTDLGRPTDAELYQGSMGIYVFNRKTSTHWTTVTTISANISFRPPSINTKSSPIYFRVTGRTLERCGPSLKQTSPSPRRFRHTTFLITSTLFTHTREFCPPARLMGRK